jgi:hypothetical protein
VEELMSSTIIIITISIIIIIIITIIIITTRSTKELQGLKVTKVKTKKNVVKVSYEIVA